MTMSTIETISSNVVRLCKEKGWTRRKLAKTLGMQEAVLSRVLSGNPQLNTLERIATALGVPVRALFDNPDTVEGYVSIAGKTRRFYTKEDLFKVIDNPDWKEYRN